MARSKKPKAKGYRGVLQRILRHPAAAQAAFALTFPTALAFVGVLVIVVYMASLSDDSPSLTQIENPDLDYATVAYSADGYELARFWGKENRSWIAYEDISEHVHEALISTEDHRFERHWGIDLFRTFSAATRSVLWKLLSFLPDNRNPFELQGGSTITQQLARNLYNDQIGFGVSVRRKLKEMVTAVQLERIYSKDEIAEFYLNTVPFRHNAFGIEAAARIYFQKGAAELDILESSTLVGMLNGPTRYDPLRNPESSRRRRNIVMRRMMRWGSLDEGYYDAHRDSLTVVNFRSAEVTDSPAPYFAEQVRQQVTSWGRENQKDVYSAGLEVHTTLDTRLQALARAAVDSIMNGLQAVVNCEWSAATSPRLRLLENLEAYTKDDCHTVADNRFAWFWKRNPELLETFIRESSRYKSLVADGGTEAQALATLLNDAVFMDSLKATKTRIEAGLVAIDPGTGYVKAWVGGPDLAVDQWDKVAKSTRQPGSTFKPFVYATAVDFGYPPSYTYTDSLIELVDPYTKEIWSPQNFGGDVTGDIITLREGLAKSLNTITAQLIIDLKPENVVQRAHAMGIVSELYPVHSLALGTSEVTLLELTTAYCTIANEGLHNTPVMVTRIVDGDGLSLHVAETAVREALNETTAPVLIDMLRDVVNQSYGTAHRIRSQFGLRGYDFAGKTGTTQEGADGWFFLMHPELVTGAWVGFNDLRVTFRSDWWGQGGHNALFVVGDFLRRVNKDPAIALSMDARFPDPPAEYLAPREDQRVTDPERRTEW